MIENKKVLVIDDEPDIRELLALTLSRMNIDCVVAEDLKQAKSLFNKHDYFLCLTDIRLPDGDGTEFVKYIKNIKPEVPVAVITAFGNIESAVQNLKAGAFDYVSKPINLALLKDLIKTAQILSESQQQPTQMDILIGKSPEIEHLKADIVKLARSQAPVFIQGSSGVGKELVANLIHKKGPRLDKPFIPVNCGAIPQELMESEFFGYKKGSFTGALKDTNGLFQAANQGTLFLDEIAELPLSMQVKLLRAIQEKAVKPVGALKEVSVDVRILSASHKNLLEEIEEGNFREDLYYRINVIELNIPPLNAHPEDIPLLVENILNKLTSDEKPTITDKAMSVLQQYEYPGNVRELENILERAITLCENNHIDVKDLQLPTTVDKIALPTDEAGGPKDLDDYLLQQQRDVIIDALEKTKWNRTKAAKLLGISFRALRYRLKKLDIE